MYYKKELKVALKKLKSKNDFTYQAGVNDALDLLDEMEEFIVLENSNQEITHKNTHVDTQRNKVENFEEKEEPALPSAPPIDFSELKQEVQELIDTPMPKSVDLKIPEVSSTISDEELMIHSNSDEKTSSITKRPKFKGWANTEDLKEKVTFEKIQDGPETDSNFNESEVIVEPQSVIEEAQEVEAPVDSEEQEKLKKAHLLAEARAQALAEAEELEEDDDE